MEKVTGGEYWKALAETYYNEMTSICESLSALDKDYLSIDKNSLLLCGEMLRNYTNKLSCKKDEQPEIPRELQVIMSLLDKLTNDMDIIRDVVADNMKVLYTE